VPAPDVTGGAVKGAGPIRWLFTTRSGGISAPPYDTLNLGGKVGDDPAAVAVNRQRLAEHLELPVGALVWMDQVHGTTVTLARSRPAGRAEECDGQVTTAAGVALAVLVADCVPMLAADPVNGVIAAVHAGRRGAADGIALRALEAMTAAGSRADQVQVLLGPAICGSCYEVPAAMRDEVEAALPGSASTTDRGTPGLDLRAGLAGQLRAAGVDSVLVDKRCTYSDIELFSHRRGSPTGRLAGVIWMSNRP
jgi:YfiH family protein